MIGDALPCIIQSADQVSTEGNIPISPQYLFDIEVYHRRPASDVLHELAWVLALDYNTLLAPVGAADVVVREYLAAHPEHTEAVIRLVRAARPLGFEG